MRITSIRSIPFANGHAVETHIAANDLQEVLEGMTEIALSYHKEHGKSIRFIEVNGKRYNWTGEQFIEHHEA